ncbi:MAG: thioredoxin [Ignavibacteriae bacterium]|nr:MAG: thioredoxin [Ignavibacteriota bacterium]
MKSILILLVTLLLSITSCKSKQDDSTKTDTTQEVTKAKITFVELGSVNCIPCKQMQPVMKSIEEKYKGQVKVVFHDVWKDKAPAQKYGIQLIPTQVFLDENGKEFFRHEGFFPEEDIDKLLQAQGLKADS